MHPELGFKELRTSAKVADELESSDIESAATSDERAWSRIGEMTTVPASPSAPIWMHCPFWKQMMFHTNHKTKARCTPCGHDSHTAMALGAATLLAKEKFPGKVRFLFQPSEEIWRRGRNQRRTAHDRGRCNGRLDMVIALHVDPAARVGNIQISDGPSSGRSRFHGMHVFQAEVVTAQCRIIRLIRFTLRRT